MKHEENKLDQKAPTPRLAGALPPTGKPASPPKPLHRQLRNPDDVTTDSLAEGARLAIEDLKREGRLEARQKARIDNSLGIHHRSPVCACRRRQAEGLVPWPGQPGQSDNRRDDSGDRQGDRANETGGPGAEAPVSSIAHRRLVTQ